MAMPVKLLSSRVFIAGQEVGQLVESVGVNHHASGKMVTTVTFVEEARVEEVDGGKVFHLAESLKAVSEVWADAAKEGDKIQAAFGIARHQVGKPEFKVGDKVRLTSKHYLYADGANNDGEIVWSGRTGTGRVVHVKTERYIDGSGPHTTYAGVPDGEVEHIPVARVGATVVATKDCLYGGGGTPEVRKGMRGVIVATGKTWPWRVKWEGSANALGGALMSDDEIEVID